LEEAEEKARTKMFVLLAANLNLVADFDGEKGAQTGMSVLLKAHGISGYCQEVAAADV
jgi:hypothetical protein